MSKSDVRASWETAVKTALDHTEQAFRENPVNFSDERALAEGVRTQLVGSLGTVEVAQVIVEDGQARGSIPDHVEYTARYRDVTESGDEFQVLRAIDWEPVEVSTVAIPADAGAYVRSDEQQNEVLITMTDETTETREGETQTRAERDRVRVSLKKRAIHVIDDAEGIR